MEASPVFILNSLVILAFISVVMLFVLRKKPGQGLSKPAALAFAFIIAGIIVGEDPRIGYTLIGIGVALALFDIYSRLKHR